MHISRLFEIVYLLMNHKTLTAKVLADRFEVSTRTIYRDIDLLSASGIPIYTNKGKGGGIRLMDHFVLNKSVLSESEQQDILTGLQGLGALQPTNESPALSKLSALFNTQAANWIEADLSDWSGQQSQYFDLLKQAILEKRVVSFDYHSANQNTNHRHAEPLQLWFKHRSWYLKAFCLERQDYRLFKLNRVNHLQMTEQTFVRILDPHYNFESSPQRQAQEVTLRLLIDANQSYRLQDEFDASQVEPLADGRYLVTLNYPEDEWVYSFIASFGPFAEVLDPPHLRAIIRERLLAASRRYEK